MQTGLSGGKEYQMAWMLIYGTEFLDALTGIQQQQQQLSLLTVKCFDD
jgi:hypothetical protein